MKLFEIIRNCSLFPIIFLKSFLIVFNRTIGQKDFGKSYDDDHGCFEVGWPVS